MQARVQQRCRQLRVLLAQVSEETLLEAEERAAERKTEISVAYRWLTEGTELARKPSHLSADTSVRVYLCNFGTQDRPNFKIARHYTGVDALTLVSLEQQTLGLARAKGIDVMPLWGDCKAPNSCALIYEMAEGSDLAQELKRITLSGQLSSSYILDTLADVAKQLQNSTCSTKHLGIIWNDLKLENLVRQNGIKLIDMEAAVVSTPRHMQPMLVDASLFPGGPLGTLGSWCPYSMLLHQVSFYTDVFSFGAIIAVMVFGWPILSIHQCKKPMMAIQTMLAVKLEEMKQTGSSYIRTDTLDVAGMQQPVQTILIVLMHAALCPDSTLRLSSTDIFRVIKLLQLADASLTLAQTALVQQRSRHQIEGFSYLAQACLEFSDLRGESPQGPITSTHNAARHVVMTVYKLCLQEIYMRAGAEQVTFQPCLPHPYNFLDLLSPNNLPYQLVGSSEELGTMGREIMYHFGLSGGVKAISSYAYPATLLRVDLEHKLHYNLDDSPEADGCNQHTTFDNYSAWVYQNTFGMLAAGWSTIDVGHVVADPDSSRIDIWDLGLKLYGMLTHLPPALRYGSERFNAFLEEIAKRQPLEGGPEGEARQGGGGDLSQTEQQECRQIPLAPLTTTAEASAVTQQLIAEAASATGNHAAFFPADFMGESLLATAIDGLGSLALSEQAAADAGNALEAAGEGMMGELDMVAAPMDARVAVESTTQLPPSQLGVPSPDATAQAPAPAVVPEGLRPTTPRRSRVLASMQPSNAGPEDQQQEVQAKADPNPVGGSTRTTRSSRAALVPGLELANKPRATRQAKAPIGEAAGCMACQSSALSVGMEQRRTDWRGKDAVYIPAQPLWKTELNGLTLQKLLNVRNPSSSFDWDAGSRRLVSFMSLIDPFLAARDGQHGDPGDVAFKICIAPAVDEELLKQLPQSIDANSVALILKIKPKNAGFSWADEYGQVLRSKFTLKSWGNEPLHRALLQAKGGLEAGSGMQIWNNCMLSAFVSKEALARCHVQYSLGEMHTWLDL